MYVKMNQFKWAKISKFIRYEPILAMLLLFLYAIIPSSEYSDARYH